MKNSNEPAFAFTDNRSSSYEDNQCYYGLSKREYLAAKAMQGILASVQHDENRRHYVNGMNLDVSLIAKDALSCADALLSELEQPVVSTETDW